MPRRRIAKVPAINILLTKAFLSDAFTLIGAIGILNGTDSGVSRTDSRFFVPIPDPRLSP
jgi:hypothetical protein